MTHRRRLWLIDALLMALVPLVAIGTMLGVTLLLMNYFSFGGRSSAASLPIWILGFDVVFIAMLLALWAVRRTILEHTEIEDPS